MPVVKVESFEQLKTILFDNSEEVENKHEKKYVVVDFYTDWCGPCKRFAPRFEELSELFDI